MTETLLETIETLLGLPSTEDFVADGISIVRRTQDYAYRSVNVAMIARNWLLGRRIVEEELVGGNSENYGKKVIARMSEKLTVEFGKGFTTSNLYMFSQFYRMFPEMFQTPSGKSPRLSWPHYIELTHTRPERQRQSMVPRTGCIRRVECQDPQQEHLHPVLLQGRREPLSRQLPSGHQGAEYRERE